MANHAGKLLLAGIVVVIAWLAMSGPADRRPVDPPAAPPAARKKVGRTTQTVLPLDEAIGQGGVPIDNATEPDERGIAALGQAYRHSMATIGGLAVEQKVKLYQAEHGDVPATHADFMAKIIAPGTPDEVRLPKLPDFQDYAFDPRTRRLVIVEFPARKAAP